MQNCLQYGRRKLITWILFVVSTTVFVGWVFVPHRSVIAQHSGATDSFFNESFSSNYIHFRTSDGEVLSGWFFNRGQGAELIICCPGNSCNAGMFASIAQLDDARSYLMLNYRGYGESSGQPKEENMVRDVIEAARYYGKKLQPIRVTVLGFSLGTGVAIQAVASMPEISRVVLVAPFDSMIDLVCNNPLKRWILKDHFRSIEYASAVKCPVYIIYSEEDKTVSPERTLRLMAEFKTPVHVLKGTGSHSDIICKSENLLLLYQALQ